MVTKEIKEFVISQMKEADWTLEKYRNVYKYQSKYLNITIGNKTEFSINIPLGYSNTELKLTRSELGFNFLHFRWLLRNVKKSCKLVDKRKRDDEISKSWTKFLERNTDLKRDSKINKIIK